MWKQLDKLLIGSTVKLHLAVARALSLDGQKKTTDAIDLLNHEYILSGNSGGTAQAEAAIELAQLYREAGNLDQAGKLLDAIPQFFSGDNLTRLEVEPAEVQPFLQAAAEVKAALKYDAQPGLADFEQAEKLRGAAKFPQAIALYQKIIKKYPNTDFAPHSTLCIGYCLLDMKQVPKAVDQLKAFTASAPGGPWRGQAFVALIDVDLEQLLDLDEAAKQVELASSAIGSALDDNESGPSWKPAAFDLYLRIGVVQFIRNQDTASDSFTQAAGSDGVSPQIKESLSALADAAKGGKPILPVGLLRPSPDASTKSHEKGDADQSALALKVGVIYNVAGRFDHAMTFFNRVGALHGTTPAELAFADFGKAAAFEGEGERAAAKDEYLASIKADPTGGWQDESIYRVARLIEANACVEYPAVPASSGDGPAAKAKPVTSAELGQRNAVERDRQEKLLLARKSALPYWDELLKQYPGSPRIPSAEYHTGILLWQMQQWSDAADLFNKLVAAYPKDPLAGDAYVRLIDMSLEDTFSLKDAENSSAAAVKWASWNTNATEEQPDSNGPSFKPWRITAYRDPQVDAGISAYAIYLRAGLTAYMDQKMDDAVALLQQGNQFDTSDRSQIVGAETGLQRMINIAQERTKPVTPAELLPMLKDDKQKTCIILADLYLEIFDDEKAQLMYERLLDGDAPFPKPSAGVESYLLFRLGQTMEFQHHHDEAIVYLTRLYEPQFAAYPWAASGISRIGTWTFNQTQDPKQAMGHWKYVFTNMPSNPDAERALFYYAKAAEQMKDYKTAIACFEEYLERYPKGEWRTRVENQELPYAVKQGPQNAR